MVTPAGAFTLRSPEAFFERLRSRLVQFCDDPNEEKALDLVLNLVHQCEWICPTYPQGSKGGIRSESPERALSLRVRQMPEFDALSRLNNGLKHFSTRKPIPVTDRVDGFLVDFSRAGDSLDVQTFFVDGTDLLTLVFPVFNAYLSYFHEAGKLGAVDRDQDF
jgi:hypothetical protein